MTGEAMPTDVMERMRETFRAEALDLLIELDSALLSLEAAPGDSALVHRVFRAIHTIKGSGATAGLTHLAGFAHNMEEAFDLAREGRLAVTPDLIDCGLKACDVIRLIVEGPGDGESVAGEEEATRAFARLLHSEVKTAQGEPAEGPLGGSRPAVDVRTAFEIVFKPKREMFYSGSDPVTLLNDLRELGQAHITAHTDQLPAFPSLDAEHCYLWWEILLVTSRDSAAIRDVFVFVEDDCEVQIRPREDQVASVALLGSVPAETFEMFGSECEDLLAGIESNALALEADPASRDDLDALFRGLHSIKGNAGLLLGHVTGEALVPGHPLQLLLRVTHGMESLLDPLRGAEAAPLPDEIIQTALETCDAIGALLKSLKHESAGAPVSPGLLERLGVRLEGAPGAVPMVDRIVDSGEAAFLNATSQCIEMIAGCLIRLDSEDGNPGPILETYRRGLRMWSAAAQYRKCSELDEPLARQLLILDAAIGSGAALGREERAALEREFGSARSVPRRMPPPPTAEALLVHASHPAGANPSPAKRAVERKDDSGGPATIRIEQNKLDRLMRVVGELLVARGAFPMLVGKLNDIRKTHDDEDCAGLAKDLKEAGSGISRIADELQTSVMSIRMLPVRTVFQRFPRLVRDLARSQGKEVRLAIEGEAIELDKTILEQIGDPLVHVIRNAVDHGLEGPEERLAQGKAATGQLTLRASHEAGGVVIEVTEDGRGIDAGALKRKAVAKGLLTQQAADGMSEEAAFQLVFLPGLSTAAKLTDISGRGVGMDVVRSNVLNLRGTIEIRSKPGCGTTFLIRLPTSLMVSKGILLNAGGQEYILPLSSIYDMVKLPRAEAHEYRGLMMAQVRGTVYSLFSLAALLGLPAANNPELSIAIVQAGALRYGLVVDRFITEAEVLVKPLVGGLEHCREFQGAAIMGDGRVVLVLNALECHALSRAA